MREMEIVEVELDALEELVTPGGHAEGSCSFDW